MDIRNARGVVLQRPPNFLFKSKCKICVILFIEKNRRVVETLSDLKNWFSRAWWLLVYYLSFCIICSKFKNEWWFKKYLSTTQLGTSFILNICGLCLVEESWSMHTRFNKFVVCGRSFEGVLVKNSVLDHTFDNEPLYELHPCHWNIPSINFTNYL